MFLAKNVFRVWDWKRHLIKLAFKTTKRWLLEQQNSSFGSMVSKRVLLVVVLNDFRSYHN